MASRLGNEQEATIQIRLGKDLVVYDPHLHTPVRLRLLRTTAGPNVAGPGKDMGRCWSEGDVVVYGDGADLGFALGVEMLQKGWAEIVEVKLKEQA
jgi:hypothetical protein